MQRKRFLVLGMMSCLLLSSCSLSSKPAVTTGKNSYSLAKQEATQQIADTDQGSDQATKEKGMYLITEMNTQSDIVTLMDLASKRTVQYAYTGGTCFYNKYKELSTQDAVQIGSIVQIEVANTTNALTKMQVSNQVWEKENISNYTIDKDNSILTINQAKYAYTNDTMFFSDDGETSLDNISDTDTLRIFGIDKKILSVVVTTGHGTLTIQNANDFVGGWLGLLGDKNSYYEIKNNMQLEVPEGNYKLTASNKGYGGSVDITITRNQNLDVDLSQIKGSAPKSAQVTFEAIVPNTTLYLDGAKVDITQPITVEYGTHSLQAFAQGYDAWNRKLVVNSDAATIPIDLTKTSDEESTESDSTSSEQKNTTNTANAANNQSTPSANTTTNAASAAGNTTGTTTNGTNSATSGASTSGSTGTNATGNNGISSSYLNTLSGIIDTLTNNSESKSSESQ